MVRGGVEPPTFRFSGGMLGQSPNSSTVWSTEVKPAFAATFAAHCSTTRPSTSTLLPQTRQVRWW